MNRLILEDIMGILPWCGVDLGGDIIMLRQPVGLLLNASPAHPRRVPRLAKQLAVRLGGTLNVCSQGHGFGCELIMLWPLGNPS